MGHGFPIWFFQNCFWFCFYFLLHGVVSFWHTRYAGSHEKGITIIRPVCPAIYLPLLPLLACLLSLLCLLFLLLLTFCLSLWRPHKYHVKSNNSSDRKRNRWSVERAKKNIKQKEQLIFFTTRFFTVVSCFFFSLFFLFNFLLIFSNCLPRAAPYRHWFAVVCFCCCYYRCCCCCFIYYCRRLVRFWHLHFHSFSSYSHFIFLSRLVRPTCPGKWKHDQKQIVKRHAAYT